MRAKKGKLQAHKELCRKKGRMRDKIFNFYEEKIDYTWVWSLNVQYLSTNAP